MSRNENHAGYLTVILSKYYIAEEKYFDIFTVYYILHMNVTIIVGIFTLVAIGAMMMSYLIFICGMFKIARYECTLHIFNYAYNY